MRLSILLSLLTMCLAGRAAACTFLQIKQRDESGEIRNTFVARSMDLEFQIFYFFGFGAIGTQNTSQVNFYKSLENSDENIATWTNTRKFVGRTSFSKQCLVDGMNDAGVWGGFLYLPDITEFPQYDPNDSRKALGVMDLLNYVLGQATSVENAFALLQEVQIVESAAEFKIGDTVRYTVQPLHLVLADKHGNGGLVEFRKGKAFFYSGKDVEVVTNAPDYEWQIRNFKRHSRQYRQRNNPGETWGGLWANGSGLAGLPGSWTPPDRFVRARQLIKFFPVAQSKEEGMLLAQQAIDSAKEPLGATCAPTIFITLSDLANRRYHYKGIAALMLSGKDGISIALDRNAGDPAGWEIVDLDKLHAGKLGKNFLLMQTTRRTTYIDPASPNINYGTSVGARTTYKTEFLSIKEFTDEFILDKLFGH